MRFLLVLVGVLLIPVCAVTTGTLWDLLVAIQPGSVRTIPLEAWAFAIGFFSWIFVYLTLPRPVRTYVLAHELTHALWGWAMGARVSRLRVSARGGSVTLSKSNVWITLAPYFFPLYTVLVLALYAGLSLFFDLGDYVRVWLACVGFTWGFHFTFTLSALLEHQSDIQVYGRTFSYSLIYLLNVLGICLWVVAVTPLGLDDLGGRLVDNGLGFGAWACLRAARCLRTGWGWLAAFLQ